MAPQAVHPRPQGHIGLVAIDENNASQDPQFINPELAWFSLKLDRRPLSVRPSADTDRNALRIGFKPEL